MKIRLATLCLCLLAAVASIYVAGWTKAPSAGSALKSHHLFNLPEEISVEELATALQELNRAVSDSGYPNAGYRLWKVTGEQKGEYSYLFEGVWPDQAAYDVIHDNQNFKKVLERCMPTFEPVLEHQVYNRFIEIPTNGPGT